MSAMAFRWARRQAGLGSNEALVLRELAYRHRSDALLYPSQERLARDCDGMSMSTLGRTLRNLRAVGLVKCKRQWVRNRQHCVYTLNFDRILVRPAETSR
jgi:pyocin large subunit-like protein